MSDETEQRYFQSMYLAFDDEVDGSELYSAGEIEAAKGRWQDVFSDVGGEPDGLWMVCPSSWYRCHVPADERMRVYVWRGDTIGDLQTIGLDISVKFFCDLDTSAIRAFLEEARQRLDEEQ